MNDALMESSIAGIRAELEGKRVVRRLRQTGKTTALLQHIHAKHEGGVAFIVAGFGSRNAELIADRWHELYPDVAPGPAVVSGSGVHKLGRGTSIPIYVDEWEPLTDNAKLELERNPNFMGGVTT